MRKFLFPLFLSIFFSFGFWSPPVQASPPTSRPSQKEKIGAPPQLKIWKAWLLYDAKRMRCPSLFNQAYATQCVWPSHLTLKAHKKGGTFTQTWHIFADSWVQLVGQGQFWPQEVLVDGKTTIVLSHAGHPVVKLKKGWHRVQGKFRWKEIPQYLSVPPQTALIHFSLLGRFKVPQLDAQGRLWLQRERTVQEKKDEISVRIVRLIKDGIPMIVENQINLIVSGRAREIVLKHILLEENLPIKIQTPLPALLDKNTLKLQVKPGNWTIRITSRFRRQKDKIGPIKNPYGQEFWAFKSNNTLRILQVSGLLGIDPTQTNIPSAWKRYPLYITKKGRYLELKTIRRGDPHPAPDRLSLHRIWWLDFDGKGFTIKDRIRGKISKNWSLTMNPEIQLGSVSINGKPRLITAQGAKKLAGVEIRQGNLQLTAISRYTKSQKILPVVGWNRHFQRVSAELRLPPGYRLLTASGVDILPGTWFQKWTLLDLFLVLIIALSVFKLTNWGWGIIAFFSMVLSYHEPYAPRIIWLSLLISLALLTVLKKGWMRYLVEFWRITSIIILSIYSLFFISQQIRGGLYPQLENIYSRDFQWNFTLSNRVGGMPKEAYAPPAKSWRKRDKKKLAYDQVSSFSKNNRYLQFSKKRELLRLLEQKQALSQEDPNALVQTGPGVPTWNWRVIRMGWNGLVDSHQKIKLVLLTPRINLFLAFIRALLLLLMFFSLVGLKRWWSLPQKAMTSILILLSLFSFAPSAQAELPPLPHQNRSKIYPNNNAAAIFSKNAIARSKRSSCPAREANLLYPPKALLQEYKRRLLKKADCFPFCAHFPKMKLKLTPKTLTVVITAHAAHQSAVPLPTNAHSWLPQKILINGQKATALFRSRRGLLWLLLPRGISQILLSGKVPNSNSFELNLPLKPNAIELENQGWKVEGIRPSGKLDNSLVLTRLKRTKEQTSFESGIVLEPFLKIERIFHLGLPPWRVTTIVKRLTPVGRQIVVMYPLLKGESITSGLEMVGGKARISMPAQSRILYFSSTLKLTPQIHLKASESANWREKWSLEVSPIWHCQLSGLTVTKHQNERGLWRPTWHPLPGEKVSIQISRPKGVKGQTLTINSARLTWIPGLRFAKAILKLDITTSHGKQHKLIIPKNAVIQRIKVAKKLLPLAKQSREILLPLNPGQQKILVEWHQKMPYATYLKTPKIHLGAQAVNATVIIQPGRKRWILWLGGPQLGPVVLFWSYLIVILLISFLLGYLKWLPLNRLQWFLLALGLTQTHPIVPILIVGWFIIFSLRSKGHLSSHWFLHNLLQLVLIFWTFIAFIGLYSAIHLGLLGIPRMQISGNHSYQSWLVWTQDRIAGSMPQAWMISLPQWIFSVAMLLWALWLSFSLIRWIRWAWNAFSKDGIWQKFPKKNVPPKTSPKKEAFPKGKIISQETSEIQEPTEQKS